MMSMIQNPRPQSDHLPPVNERTRRQERGEIMSMIQNPRPQSDHLHPMNERTRRQERGEMMSMIQNPRPQSGHLPPTDRKDKCKYISLPCTNPEYFGSFFYLGVWKP